MCGIAGMIHTGDATNLAQMVDSIRHRGPDHHASVWFPEHGSGLGHTRLAIIHRHPSGNQPMRTSDGRFWIVSSGELFNHQILRKTLEQKGHIFISESDTEVILESFREWGISALQRFVGMYSFAIFDRESGRLVLARDRIGVKPLYYAQTGGGLVFSSEVKAILASGRVSAEPDLEALRTPTRFQVAPFTGFAGIRKVPPACYLIYEHAKISTFPYWTLDPNIQSGIDEREAEQELGRLLAESVRLHSLSDVPVGVLLSGGLDSTLIASLMRDGQRGEIHSFCANPGNEQGHSDSDDAGYARKAAEHLRFVHHELDLSHDVAALLPKVVYHLDEPLADPAALSVYLLAESARKHGVPVLMSGMGGDEIFAGYRKYVACLQADLYQAVLSSRSRRKIEPLLRGLFAQTGRMSRRARWADRFFSFASLPRLERYLCSDMSFTPDQFESVIADETQYESTPYFRKHSTDFGRATGSYLSAMCFCDTTNFLPEHNFLYTEKAAMAHGVEVRPPLANHPIVEFVFGLPASFRIRRLTQKYLLKQVGKRYLPALFVERPKRPFGSPVRAWLRGPLREMVDDLLSVQRVSTRGIFRPDQVRSLVAADRSGREDNSLGIWALLTTEIWFQTFIDNQLSKESANRDRLGHVLRLEPRGIPGV